MVDEMIPQPDSKVVVGSKRGGEELEEDSERSHKHHKTRDLQSVPQPEGIDTHEPETSKTEEPEDDMDIVVETQSSQVIDKNASEIADARHLERVSNKSSKLWVGHNASKPLDLNTELCTDENSGYNDAVMAIEDARNHSLYGEGKSSTEHKNKSSGTTHLDLNAEDVASSAIQDPFYNHSRSHNHFKTRDSSECGRTTGRSEEKDALRKWKEMKQNGFMSPSYGGIPAAPKQRGRKSKSDVLKQKMEQAKKEQVDRFTKIAAPSGLLNGLNPGIINHVRNSKQVHAIIQALVRSEKRESRKQANEMKAMNRDITEGDLEQRNINVSGVHGSSLYYEGSALSSMPESNLLYGNHFLHSSTGLLSSEDKGGSRDSVTEEGTFYANTSFASSSKKNSEEDILTLKLSSSTMVSESTSCLSNEESTNGNSVDTLSIKAATVASQWLQLLHQDVKGRLAALRRSKKRVRSVISTELPFLLSKEFSSNQENVHVPYIMKDSASGSNNTTAEMHQTQWSKLFDQMDTSLSEEEKQLESWLNQVDKMLLHCDGGLQHVHTVFEMQRLGAVDNEFRPKINDPDKDLSVMAAAASIYSTSNFLSSRKNVSCC